MTQPMCGQFQRTTDEVPGSAPGRSGRVSTSETRFRNIAMQCNDRRMAWGIYIDRLFNRIHLGEKRPSGGIGICDDIVPMWEVFSCAESILCPGHDIREGGYVPNAIRFLGETFPGELWGRLFSLVRW